MKFTKTLTLAVAVIFLVTCKEQVADSNAELTPSVELTKSTAMGIGALATSELHS